jgi:hypothetical protein
MTDGLDAFARRLGEVSPRWFLRFVLILASALTFWLAIHLGSGGVLFVFWRRTLLVFVVAGFALALFVGAWLIDRVIGRLTPALAGGASESRLPLRSRPSSAESAKADFAGVGAVSNRPAAILVLALFIFLLLSPLAKAFQPLPARFILLFIASLLLTFALSSKPFSQSWPSFLLSFIILSSLYQLITNYQLLSLSPFSRGWSEGTRFYHASLLLSERYYGLSLPPFYQDLSRYVVEAVPLLLPNPSLFVERLWEYSLTFILPALTSALALRRVGRDGIPPSRQSAEYHSAPQGLRALRLALFLFGALYLLQGPVYFYLLLAAIPVLAFYHPQKPILSILALLVASFWAGISRVNWIPIPAMLAIALYLLETPFKKNLLRYLASPVVFLHLEHLARYVQRRLLATAPLVSSLPQRAPTARHPPRGHPDDRPPHPPHVELPSPKPLALDSRRGTRLHDAHSPRGRIHRQRQDRRREQPP